MATVAGIVLLVQDLAARLLPALGGASPPARRAILSDKAAPDITTVVAVVLNRSWPPRTSHASMAGVDVTAGSRVDLPEGTVTFLLTDVEGSTRLWGQRPDLAGRVLARHDEMAFAAVAAHGGVIPHRGEGDSLLAAFARPEDAVSAALALQLALRAEDWPEGVALRVRMALHTGEAAVRAGDYEGLEVNRTARLRGIAHGGQTLLSQTTAEAVADRLPAGASLIDLGRHRLKDLDGTERVWQLAHPGVVVDFPPLLSFDAIGHNLPVPLNRFIGRNDELKELRRLLATERLLTLTGAGGVGKTRLALELVARAADAFPDGVWLAELSPLADGELVAQAVAQALHVREEPGEPVLTTLARYARDKELLLVLDNCEHVAGAAAGVAQTLLEAAPRLRIVATGQVPLHLGAEVTWRVPPMAAPDADRLPSLEALASYEAVALFVDRARSARPDFVLSTGNAAMVGNICRRLDGIPLAIELAAARVRHLGPREILDRLDDRLRLLSGGSRSGPERHQTLRAAIDWSHDQLTPPERALLRRLSVFVGGCSLGGAEAVGAGPGLPAERVVDALCELVDKSFVVADLDESGQTRYRLLETFRQYGRERLDRAGETSDAEERHLAYFVSLAEDVEPVLAGEEVASGLARLDEEAADLRAALAWAREHAVRWRGLRLAGILWPFWRYRGHLREGRRWLRDMLDLPNTGDVDASILVRALVGAATVAIDMSDYEEASRCAASAVSVAKKGSRRDVVAALNVRGRLARALDRYADSARDYGEALALASQAGDRAGEAAALIGSAHAAMYAGDPAAAHRLAEDGLLAARLAGDVEVLGDALFLRAWQLTNVGEFERGETLGREALTFARVLGHTGQAAEVLFALGSLACFRADYEAAVDLFEEGLTLARGRADQKQEGMHLAGSGWAVFNLGDPERARTLLARSLDLHRRAGETWGIAMSLTLLGHVELAGGDVGRARERLAEAAERFAAIGNLMYLPWCLEGLAGVAVAAGAHGLAGELDAARDAVREQVGMAIPPAHPAGYERLRAEIRAALAPDELAAAHTAGTTRSAQQTIAAALNFF